MFRPKQLSRLDSDFIKKVWKRLEKDVGVYIITAKDVFSDHLFVEYDDENKIKIIRTFLDDQDADNYVALCEEVLKKNGLKVSLTAVPTKIKSFIESLAKIYGPKPQKGKKNSKESDYAVQCILSTFNSKGDMVDVDLIWSEIGN